MPSISSIPAAAPPPPDPRKKWIFAGACAAALVLFWLIYSRIDHYLLAARSTPWTEQSKDLDEEIDRANKSAPTRPTSPSGPTKT